MFDGSRRTLLVAQKIYIRIHAVPASAWNIGTMESMWSDHHLCNVESREDNLEFAELF